MTTPRKKRQRYKKNAAVIAEKIGITIDVNDWNQVWALLDEHADKYHAPEYLYAILDGRNRLVKFGRSKAPSARLSALQVGNGAGLTLLCYCEHKSPFTEREIHTELSAFRISGEWFALCDGVQNKINQIRSRIAYG